MILHIASVAALCDTANVWERECQCTLHSNSELVMTALIKSVTFDGS